LTRRRLRPSRLGGGINGSIKARSTCAVSLA
jgi:hypothetical protein